MYKLRKTIKILVLFALAAVVLRGAYRQGVQHAIETARPWAEDGVYLIAFDGDIHEYIP